MGSGDPPRRHLGMLLRQIRQRTGLSPETAAEYMAKITREPASTEQWIAWETGAEMGSGVFNVVLVRALLDSPPAGGVRPPGPPTP